MLPWPCLCEVLLRELGSISCPPWGSCFTAEAAICTLQEALTRPCWSTAPLPARGETLEATQVCLGPRSQLGCPQAQPQASRMAKAPLSPRLLLQPDREQRQGAAEQDKHFLTACPQHPHVFGSFRGHLGAGPEGENNLFEDRRKARVPGRSCEQAAAPL